MLDLGLFLGSKKLMLVDTETGEIYAETIEEINAYLKEHENNYLLRLLR